MASSADPDQFRSQLIWIYTVRTDRTYPGSAGLGLSINGMTSKNKTLSLAFPLDVNHMTNCIFKTNTTYMVFDLISVKWDFVYSKTNDSNIDGS